MIATIAAVTFPFLIYWLSVSVIDETPSLFPLSLPVSVFSQSPPLLATSHPIPPFPNIWGGLTVWSLLTIALCSILARTKWSFIDRWYQAKTYVSRRYFWTLPGLSDPPRSSLKENSSLKCFQFSRYCKSLSKVTQTNDTELSSKNILKQNTVWSNITRHGREKNPLHNI